MIVEPGHYPVSYRLDVKLNEFDEVPAAVTVHVGTKAVAARVARDGREMDGKSIMGILLLAAACGSTITITAEGADEDAAVEALAALVHSGFGEDTA